MVSGGSGGSVLAQQMLAQLANDWDKGNDEDPEALSPALAQQQRWQWLGRRFFTRAMRCLWQLQLEKSCCSY